MIKYDKLQQLQDSEENLLIDIWKYQDLEFRKQITKMQKRILNRLQKHLKNINKEILDTAEIKYDKCVICGKTTIDFFKNDQGFDIPVCDFRKIYGSENRCCYKKAVNKKVILGDNND